MSQGSYAIENPMIFQQYIQNLVDEVTNSMQSLIDPNPPLASVDVEAVEPMQSLVNPTLPLESDKHQVVELMQYSNNTTLPLDSDLYTTQVFFTTKLELFVQGGT